MIAIRSSADIAKIEKSCKVIKRCFEAVKPHIKSGVSTAEIDAIIEDFLKTAGVKPAFKGYNGFPAVACISPNDVVVHGIPSPQVVLSEGDIVSIDMGCILDGWYSDAARTFPVGRISAEKARLISVTEQSFFEGARQARAGNFTGDIGAAVQSYVESQGFSVVRALCGHGVGRRLHEPPEVPNFGSPKTGARLASGNVLAIEPMVNVGTYQVRTDSDRWTCRTSDGLASAHYENTLVITDGDPIILTL